MEAGVRAVFGFPLAVGAVRLGALNLYSDRPGPLTDDQHADALVMADVAAEAVLAMQAGRPPGMLAAELEQGSDFQYVVHQASGMVSAQLDVSVGQALRPPAGLRLRQRAPAGRRGRRRRRPRLRFADEDAASARVRLATMAGERPNRGRCGQRGRVMPREALLARTLVELADTLVDDFDVVELLTLLADRCVEVLDVAAAGLMLASPDGDLRVMASSSEAMRVLELFELQADEGPCVDCYRTGEPDREPRPARTIDGRWPRFGPKAVEAGFRSVHALPMRLRGQTIGALNLFRVDEGPMRDADVVAAQALADVATIAILQHRAVHDAQVLNEQLTQALTDRIVIEQAKGVVAERAGLDMEQAFARLRRHARNHNLRLTDVAQAVSSKALPVASLDV